MIKLSLCMIVKNESIDLPGCLESVREVVEEAIVLDTGSTDNTVAIARGFGARVSFFPWNGNFSDARNEALQYVTGDWVLVLDADERLNRAMVPFIRAAMGREENLAINFLRREIGAVQSPYSLVSRLFRKHPRVCFTRPYHAIIDDTVADLLAAEPGWRVAEIPEIGIDHYGYTAEKIRGLGKFDRAREAMEGFYRDHPTDPYVCSKLGALYLKMGREVEGMELLARGLAANGENPHILYELHYHLANAHVRRGEGGQAIEHYRHSLEQPILEVLKIGSYNNIGGVFESVGNWDEARKAFETAIAIDPGFAMGYYNLGTVYRKLQQFLPAIQAYQKAIELNPDYPEAYQNLGVAFLSFGNYHDAVRALQSAALSWEARGNSIEAAKIRQNLKAIGVE